MIWLKKNLLFTFAMAVLGAVLVVETVMILGQRAEAREAEDAFRSKVDEYRRLAGGEVLPHRRNVENSAAEIERQRDELQLYHASMQGRSGLSEAFADHPTSRSDAFFDIASFVDDYRERAIAAGLSAEDVQDSHFGFEAYSSVGPAEGRLASVYKQRLVVAYILDRLFEAEPKSLVEVRRPGDGGENGNRGGTFQLSPQFTAAIPDVADTSAYQVVFTGRASTLRSFLNQLTSFDMPLIVRNVRVAPAGQAGERRRESSERRQPRRAQRSSPAETEAESEDENGAESRSGERIPLVADNLSRFTVSMEFVDVKPVEDADE